MLTINWYEFYGISGIPYAIKFIAVTFKAGIFRGITSSRISLSREPPGRGGPIWNRRGCSSEILNLTPKGDHLGVAQAFCDP